MDTASPPKLGRIRFGVFELDVRARELRKQGVRVKLQEQPFQVLQVLLERPGDVLTREELRQRIWPSDTFVDFEGGVYNAVKKLREALGDTADTPRFIETLPRRGYRFIGTVNGSNDAAPMAQVSAKADRKNSSTASQGSRIGLGVGLGAVVLLFALFGLVPADFWQRFSGKGTVPQIRSVAVLPLKNLSDDPSQRYFAYGMAEELITDLSQMRTLKVVSHTSVLRYENTDKTVPQVARELGVDALVAGSVQRSADRVRITAQLIYAPNDTNLWARTYDRDLRDVLALQSTVAKEIVDEIGVKITPEETARLTKPRVVNPKALDAYWKGQYHLSSLTENGGAAKDQEKSGQEEEFRQAIAYFEEAIRQDPNYAPAYLAYFGSVDFFQNEVDPSARNLIPEGRSALMKALALDDTLANAHLALADAFFFYDWNWAGAEKEYKRSLELGPNSAETHYRYACFLDSMGRLEEGLKEHELQLQLDPDLDVVQTSPLVPLESRIERERRFVETHRRVTFEHYWNLGLLLWKTGRYKEATDVWQDFMTRLGYTDVAQAIGRGYAKDGYPGAMREWARAGEAAARQRYVARILMAYIYGVLGDNDRAFAWLEKAYAEHESSLQSLKFYEAWDPLRSDPRFKDLVRRVGLPQ